jgi:outer membrane lipoprotein
VKETFGSKAKCLREASERGGRWSREERTVRREAMQGQGFTKFLLVTGLVLFAAGCAYPISQELRDEARPNLTFAMVLKDPGAYVGSIVIWGGTIIGTTALAKGSEITVLELPLDRWGRPEGAGLSEGRFIARYSGFLDPAVYRQGQEVTLAGEVVGKEVRPVGQVQYTYPVVMIKELRLWRREPTYVYPPPAYYWGWGWYSYPYWYGDYDWDDFPGDRDWGFHDDFGDWD